MAEQQSLGEADLRIGIAARKPISSHDQKPELTRRVSNLKNLRFAHSLSFRDTHHTLMSW